MRGRGAVVVAAVLAWEGRAAAGDPSIAREQLKIGYALAHHGKCEEALPHLAESLRLDPKAITLINLADCEETTGRLTDAMAHWVDARARAQSDGLRDIEEEATKRATELEARIPRLTIVLAGGVPNDAIVTRDGVVLGPPSIGAALPIAPGSHRITVTASGRFDSTTTVTIAEREAKTVAVDIGAPIAVARPIEAPRIGPSPLVYVGFGVAALGATLGSVTGIEALHGADRTKTLCPNLQCDRAGLDYVERSRTFGTVATISFVVAGAGAALGVYGLTLGRRRIDVAVAPSSVRVEGRF